MPYLLTKLVAALFVVGLAIGVGHAKAAPLPGLDGVASETSPIEKVTYYGYRRYGGYYPYYRYYNPYRYYRPYYGYRKPYYRNYGYRYRPYYRRRYW